jgi:Uma2 family endonuclease
MTVATTAVATATIETQPCLLDVRDVKLRVTSEQFDRLCVQNSELRLELTKDGELIVMPPTGGESGKRNGNLFGEVWFWNRQTNLGEAFDSSTGYDFMAIGGGKMSPDVSWIEKSRLVGVEIVGFIPIVPDFVIELRSATDNLSPLQEKMAEYQRLGVKLGLLVNPKNKQIELYRPGQNAVTLDTPSSIDCGEVMPGFVLSMDRIW